jgi:glycosyltransferase involved in cell wall biosynthesis
MSDSFKISLGMIVKNEERTLRAALESVAPFVDEIVIGLGGSSTDDTEAIAREFTDKVFPIEWTDNFSDARNEVLKQVTGDYLFWIDGDDVLLGGEHLRQVIRINPNIDQFFMGYDYARDENGNNICYLVRERLIRLQDELVDRGWKWVGAIHEVLVPQNFNPSGMLVSEIVVQHHKPAGKHEADRNTNILYSQLAEGEPNPDPRILGYLCTENAGRGNYREAILHGQRFVQLSKWSEERYQMQHRVADMYRMLGDYPKALEADFKAIEIQPDWPDAFLGIAETYNLMGHYRATVEWTKTATTKPSPTTMLIINPLDYTFTPSVILAAAYAHLGDYEMALENYKLAFNVKPGPEIANLIRNLEEEIELHKSVDAFLRIRAHLGSYDEWLKVRKLFDCVPKRIEMHPAIQDAWKRSMFQTAHIDDPKIMEDFYKDNPNWHQVKEDQLLSEEWLSYPRLKFAIDTAIKANAKNVVDWGCSDGFISLPLSKAASCHVTGFDLDPRCIELASERAGRLGYDARFETGNVDDLIPGTWEGEKADLAIFFETIEHVVDPARTLAGVEKSAKRIAITTPYLAFDGGRLPEWDRLEPKGHLRVFDQYDIERIIAPRGKIHQLYPYLMAPERGWLFADYTPGELYTGSEIIIGALNSPEAWNPMDFERQGLGGSETAVIRLGQSFAKQGHRVVTYSTIDKPGYYDDVCYRPTEHFRPDIESDMYIAWRSPEAADWDIKTKRLVLWLHDTDYGDRLTIERARLFDNFVVLSEWHKEHFQRCYPFVSEHKIVVIGNGVDIERFIPDVLPTRNPKQVIYSSSPDRGLDIILEHIWPKVIEAVPDAELHTYYGWNNFEKFAKQWPHLAEFQRRCKELIANTTGIIQHGRVDQTTLAEAFMRSSVWLYPTYFTETYCITAVEAQLGGAIPITNHLAALAETVRSGWIIDGDVHDPEVQEQYVKAVITALQTPMDKRPEHDQVKINAPALSWDDIAASWSHVFLEGDTLSGERPLRRGQELLPERVDQLGSGTDPSSARFDRESTNGVRVQRESEHSVRERPDWLEGWLQRT